MPVVNRFADLAPTIAEWRRDLHAHAGCLASPQQVRHGAPHAHHPVTVRRTPARTGSTKCQVSGPGAKIKRSPSWGRKRSSAVKRGSPPSRPGAPKVMAPPWSARQSGQRPKEMVAR